jgi:hypothetical protein
MQLKFLTPFTPAFIVSKLDTIFSPFARAQRGRAFVSWPLSDEERAWVGQLQAAAAEAGERKMVEAPSTSHMTRDKSGPSPWWLRDLWHFVVAENAAQRTALENWALLPLVANGNVIERCDVRCVACPQCPLCKCDREDAPSRSGTGSW